jgi:hypothetical protein
MLLVVTYVKTINMNTRKENIIENIFICNMYRKIGFFLKFEM